jgi:hypothetical protein
MQRGSPRPEIMASAPNARPSQRSPHEIGANPLSRSQTFSGSFRRPDRATEDGKRLLAVERHLDKISFPCGASSCAGSSMRWVFG